MYMQDAHSCKTPANSNSNLTEAEDFKRTVEIWEKKVLQLPVASNLSTKTMLKTLGEATGGLYSGSEGEVRRSNTDIDSNWVIILISHTRAYP